MGSDALSARELTRRLVARPAVSGKGPDGAALAVHAACERTYRELTRALGLSGSEALLLRAIAEAQLQHPLLKEIRIGRTGTSDLDGVTAMVQAHGAPAVSAALEAVLERLFALLGRLIGDDMVARLVDQASSIERTMTGT